MGIDDFLRQIPGGLILMTCGSGILLVVMWGFIFWRRGQRRAARPEAASALSVMPAGSTEESSPPADAAKPSGNTLRKIGASIRNFFFYTEEEKQAKAAAQPTAPARPTAAPAAGALPTPDNSLTEAVEVLRVWRDVADGSLLIQIGSERYRTLEEIRAAGQSRRFIATLREMALIAKDAGPEDGRSEAAPRPIRQTAPATPTPAPAAQTPPPIPPAAAPVEPPPTPIAAEPPAPSTPPTDTARPAEDARPYPSRKSSVEDMEPIGSFFDNVRRAVRDRGKEKAAGPATVSIPDQIEAYLQYRLALTPPFLGRSIHVREAPGGGVRIEVDGRFYEAVSDIEDTTVRDFVRTAIQEWEDRQ